MSATINAVFSQNLVAEELKELINQIRKRVFTTINSELIMLKWSIGKRIKTEINREKRSEYGEEIVATLSDFLLRAKRDAVAVKAFFRKAFRFHGRPDKITVE
jgi:2C-methyl-D-erythritol 2,4-cyclodiphosphate synthase